MVTFRSFVAAKTMRNVSVPTDRYRFCHKTAEGVDVLMNHDQRDMSHIAAVYGWALAATLAPDAGYNADRVLSGGLET